MQIPSKTTKNNSQGNFFVIILCQRVFAGHFGRKTCTETHKKKQNAQICHFAHACHTLDHYLSRCTQKGDYHVIWNPLACDLRRLCINKLGWLLGYLLPFCQCLQRTEKSGKGESKNVGEQRGAGT